MDAVIIKGNGVSRRRRCFASYRHKGQRLSPISCAVIQETSRLGNRKPDIKRRLRNYARSYGELRNHALADGRGNLLYRQSGRVIIPYCGGNKRGGGNNQIVGRRAGRSGNRYRQSLVNFVNKVVNNLNSEELRIG